MDYVKKRNYLRSAGVTGVYFGEEQNATRKAIGRAV